MATRPENYYICILPNNYFMPKTREQTRRHLRDCIFGDDEWKTILEFCKLKYGGGSIHRPQNPIYESSYSQFTDWFDNGYGSGDIVVYNGNPCIVSDENPDGVVICVMVDNGSISTEKIIVGHNDVCPANDNEAGMLMAALRNSGFRYSDGLSRLVKIYRPLQYERVGVFINGEWHNGIFDGFDGNNVKLVFHIDNGKLVYGHNGACDIRRISKDGINEIDNVLTVNGLMWNHRTHHVEPIAKRAKKGDTYWYISDKFTIVNGRDNYNLVHNSRFKRGNYFVNYKNALDFLIRIMEIRKTGR